MTTLHRANKRLLAAPKISPRILLVDVARALHELHLALLRSIPAFVETLASYADMYLHQEHGYALVILVLNSNSREMAEAAHFVRRRWTAARILLLGNESTTIDDWLYDERVEPHSHPATLREAAVRLLIKERCRIPA